MKFLTVPIMDFRDFFFFFAVAILLVVAFRVLLPFFFAFFFFVIFSPISVPKKDQGSRAGLSGEWFSVWMLFPHL